MNDDKEKGRELGYGNVDARPPEPDGAKDAAKVPPAKSDADECHDRAA